MFVCLLLFYQLNLFLFLVVKTSHTNISNNDNLTSELNLMRHTTFRHIFILKISTKYTGNMEMMFLAKSFVL